MFAALLLLSSAATLFCGFLGLDLDCCKYHVENENEKYYLLLDKLQLLGLQQFLRNALSITLRAQTQLPQLFAEYWGVFVKEPSELDLHLFNIRLQHELAWHKLRNHGTYKTRSFKETEAQFNNNIVLAAEYA